MVIYADITAEASPKTGWIIELDFLVHIHLINKRKNALALYCIETWIYRLKKEFSNI